MTLPETRYDTHDQELLAIVDAFKHWRRYAHSCSELEVHTDYKNLTFFTTTKVLTGRQARWAEWLGQFKFKIVYKPGKENVIADVLSRRKDLIGDKPKVREPIFKTNEDGSLSPARQLNSTFEIANDIPAEYQEMIIHEHHDDPLHGHLGIRRTIELIQRNYHFNDMKEKVAKYIRKCADCQKNKHSTH